jgi:hypothetical protein
MMRTDGTPLEAARSATRTVAEGDVERNPDTQAPAAPPSLRNPGEKLPTDDEKTGVMKPVQFPKPKPAPQPGANPDGEPDTQPAAPAQPASSAHPSGSPQSQGPAQPAPADAAPKPQPPAPSGSGQPN